MTPKQGEVNLLMNERLKMLRKALGLTQEEFAQRIGVKRGAIANYEIGRNVPVDAVYSLICKEFGVNPDWLRTGEGDMFAPPQKNALDALADEKRLSVGERILIEKFLALPAEVRAGIVDYVVEAAAALKECGISKSADDGIDVDAEVASYREELLLQKEAEARSSASGGRNASAG